MKEDKDRLPLGLMFLLLGIIGIFGNSEIVCRALIIFGIVLLVVPYLLNNKMKGGNHGNKRKFKK